MRTAAAIAGLLICLFMLWNWLRDDLRRLGRQQTTRGEIVDIHTSVDSDDVRTYTAVVRFETGDGPMKFTDDYSSTRRPIEGSTITVQYPTGQPSLARIPRPLFKLFAYAVTTGLDLTMIAILAGALPA